jgi:hypothetical protein
MSIIDQFTRDGLGKKASAAIGFIKATETLRRKPHTTIPLKMYFKSLEILEKASISLKKSLKITEIFIKALNF